MSENRLIGALLSGQPYFGLGLRALQGAPERHKYLPAILKKALERRPSGTVRVLEVGTWAGTSAVTWAKTLQALGRSGQVTCVDTWASYIDLGVNTDDIYTEMDRLAKSGEIKKLFDHNVRTSGVSDLIRVKIGASQKILPRFRERSFDLIYIDGDHDYRSVRSDIINAKRLIREHGVICGDDLEASADEIEPGILERFTESPLDFVNLPELGRSFHPGVTRAVGEELGQVSCWEGVWAVTWDGQAWQRFDIDTATLSLPAHVAAELVDDRSPGDSAVLVKIDVAGHNIVRFRSRFFALPQVLGPINMAALSRRELALLESDSDLDRLTERLNSIDLSTDINTQSEWKLAAAEEGVLPRDRVIRALSGDGLHMEPEVVERDVNAHDIVRWRDRYYAVARQRGSVDLRQLSEDELDALPNDAEPSRLRRTLASTPGEVQIPRPRVAAPAGEVDSVDRFDSRTAPTPNYARTSVREAAVHETPAQVFAENALPTGVKPSGNSGQNREEVTRSLQYLEQTTTKTAELPRMAKDDATANIAEQGPKFGQLQQTLVRLSAELGQCDQRVAALSEGLARTGSDFAERDSRIAALEGQLARTEAALADRADAAALAQTDERLTVLDARLEEISLAVGERATAIADGLAKRDERIAVLHQLTEEVQTESRRNDLRLASLEATISELKQVVTELRAGASERTRRANIVERDFAIQHERLAGIEAVVARLPDELSGISSTLGETLKQRDNQLQSLEKAVATLQKSDATSAIRACATERDLAVQAERLTRIEAATDQSSFQTGPFPPSRDILPHMKRKDSARSLGSTVSVSASAPSGHFLFGPYLIVEPGVYIFELSCTATAIGDRAKPVITVEIGAGPFLIGHRALSADSLDKPVRIAFEISEAARYQGAALEFRISHHNNAEIEVTAARLHTVSGGLPAAVGTVLGRRRSWWWSRWLGAR